jgi:hypothetical protein
LLRSRDRRLERLDERPFYDAVEQVAQASGYASRGPRSRLVALYRTLLSPQIASRQAGKEAAETAYTADKDPRLIEFLPAVRSVFLRSHVVHIVRDPRDVLLSKSRAEWSRHRNWRLNMAAGRFQLDLADRAARELYGWRYHVVRYEDLISEPERTLRRLTHSLDLDYDESMLSYSEAAARLTDESDAAWKGETRGPLLAANSGKWRSALTRRQAAVTESVYARWFRRYGYACSRRHGLPGRARRFLYGVLSALYGALRRRGLGRVFREIGREARQHG